LFSSVEVASFNLISQLTQSTPLSCSGIIKEGRSLKGTKEEGGTRYQGESFFLFFLFSLNFIR